MSLPLSYLESILSQIKLDEVTVEAELREKDEKEGEQGKEEKEHDRKAEDEAKPETKQEVEGAATSKKRRTKRARPDNPKETVKDRKPSSQKSK